MFPNSSSYLNMFFSIIVCICIIQYSIILCSTLILNFFYFSGSIVLWNVTDLESSNILNFLRQYEEDSYSERLIQAECEVMKYKYSKTERLAYFVILFLLLHSI